MSSTRIDRPAGIHYMNKIGLTAEPWQTDILDGGHQRLLLNCCRQSGKSTVVALLSLLEACFRPNSLVLLLSPSLRQSTELFRKVTDFHIRLNSRLLEHRTKYELRLQTGSRIVSLPCSEDTVRGFSDAHMIVIDEAARVPDDLYRAVRPMLAHHSDESRLVCLSTPYGKRGFFYNAWAHGPEWKRIEIPAAAVPRMTQAFLDEERRNHGEAGFRQEYCCSFEALEGLVYPDFAKRACAHKGDAALFAGSHGAAASPDSAKRAASPLCGRKLGGIDFGFRNPFAAVWGVLDRDGVLWLTGEHYEHMRPLSHHIEKIPRDVEWYADPSGASDIADLRCAGFHVLKGRNALRAGIAAVTARLEDGTLRVLEGACPNLLAEAELYHYETKREHQKAEQPQDEHNHALAALRYLIAALDAHKLRRKPAPSATATPAPPNPQKPWLRYDNEALWTRIM